MSYCAFSLQWWCSHRSSRDKEKQRRFLRWSTANFVRLPREEASFILATRDISATSVIAIRKLRYFLDAGQRLACSRNQPFSIVCLLGLVQGPPTHIDTFQTNIFSWFNDSVIQTQWFLGSWDREIWYKTLFFHFFNLTWPPWPQKEKI